MATAVVRRRRRRRLGRRLRTDVVGDHHEAGVTSPGLGKQGRPTTAAATSVHVTGWPAAECGRRPSPRRVIRWHHSGQGPVQVAVRRTAGPGHAPSPGRYTSQRAQQEAGLVRTVSIFILLKVFANETLSARPRGRILKICAQRLGQISVVCGVR